MKRHLIVVVACIAIATFLGGSGIAEPAAAAPLTPQQTVELKIAFNAPLTPTDQYVFLLMVKGAAPKIPDQAITDALAWYKAGVRDPILQLPTSTTLLPIDNGPVVTEAMPVASADGAVPAGSTAGLCPVKSHGFTQGIQSRNAVGTRLFSSTYGIAWKTMCGVTLVGGLPGELLGHDVTAAGHAGGWRLINGPYPFDTVLWQGKFQTFCTFGGCFPYGIHHRVWQAKYERCYSIWPFPNQVCGWDTLFDMHVDVVGDGRACFALQGGAGRCVQR